MTRNPIKSRLLFRGNVVELSTLSNRVAIVTFDSKVSKVNLLSSLVMKELDHVVKVLEKPGEFVGAVFRSSKDDCFIAGADIKEIQYAQSMPPEIAYDGCNQGKALLARIEALPFPTVAAIRGRCLGGGTELTLVCKYRLATDNKSTVIGLPEVALGVLPGWGGTVRAPLMLGFAAAVPLITNPLKPWSARKALQTGLVDELVPESKLFSRAVGVVLGESPPTREPSAMQKFTRAIGDSAIGVSCISALAALAIKVQTRGKYPAPLEALKVMKAAMRGDKNAAMVEESCSFANLCHTPASAECVAKFVEYQKAKKEKKAAV